METIANTTNVSLYIKRAELTQTERYIHSVFSENVGDVENISFIEKTNNANGAKYHSVIVRLGRINDTPYTKKLMHDIYYGSDNSSKIHHSKGYWIVAQHTTNGRVRKNIDMDHVLPDADLPHQERIKRLEDMVVSLSNELKTCREKIENDKKTFANYDAQHTKDWLATFSLHSQLEDSELRESDLKQEVNELRAKIGLSSPKTCDQPSICREIATGECLSSPKGETHV